MYIVHVHVVHIYALRQELMSMSSSTAKLHSKLTYFAYFAYTAVLTLSLRALGGTQTEFASSKQAH